MSKLLPNLRMSLAVLASRSTSAASRRLGRGGGTAIPGLVAERIDPGLIGKFVSKLDLGTVVVAGTNGKTTTCKMIADILKANGARVVHNGSGSNLVQGVAAAVADNSSFFGEPQGNVGVIEADEAAFPEIVRRVQPDVVLLNNLYRDQLDRYGELKTIMNKWGPALESLPETCTIVVNVDDPALAGLTRGLKAQVVTIGMSGLTQRLERLSHASDSITCPECGTALVYDALYLSHLGEWRCEACGLNRPALYLAGTQLDLLGEDGLELTIEISGERHAFKCGMPGIYNAYNLLAAVAVAGAFNIELPVMQEAVERFQPAFGRIERLRYLDRDLTIALVKNPVGFNEVLRMLTQNGALSTPTLIIINDLDADSRDVSWLWDVDFEMLAGDGPFVATAGIRGTDMANRLKYAGLHPNRIVPLGENLAAALTQFVERVPDGSTAWILPTYTAMLGARKELVNRGAVDDYWR